MFRTGQTGINTRLFRFLLLASVVVVAMPLDGPAIAAEEIAKLGEPRRNVVPQARPTQGVAQLLARERPAASGVIPLMIWPSNGLVVEAAFDMVSLATCKSILAAYDRRLRAQHGDKIRHGLYCVSIAGGKLKSIDTVAKSF